MSESQPETNSEVEAKAPENNQVESHVDGEGEETTTNSTPNSTKGRRSTPNKPKISRIMKDVQEGEALLKEMGHEIDGADGGRRRTRSSTRGGPPPPPTPPPVKRQRRSGSSTATANNSSEKEAQSASGGRGRGRPKKNDAEKDETPGEDSKDDVPQDSSTDDVQPNVEPVKSDSTEGTAAKKEKESPVRVNVTNATEPEKKEQKPKDTPMEIEKPVERIEKATTPTPTPGNNISSSSVTDSRNDVKSLNKDKEEPQPVISSTPTITTTPLSAADPTPPANSISKSVELSPSKVVEPERDIPSLPPKSEVDPAQANSHPTEVKANSTD
jgi:hypothetical protein